MSVVLANGGEYFKCQIISKTLGQTKPTCAEKPMQFSQWRENPASCRLNLVNADFRNPAFHRRALVGQFAWNAFGRPLSGLGSIGLLGLAA